jgi:hypothetical protein
MVSQALFGVRDLAVFGSVARGDASDASDLWRGIPRRRVANRGGGARKPDGGERESSWKVARFHMNGPRSPWMVA